MKHQPPPGDGTLEQAEQLRPWIEGETGMDFSGSRLTRLQDGLRKVSLLEALKLDPKALESAPFLERLTAQLTVGESFFFRNASHFAALRDHVGPDIFAHNQHRREVRLWSAGCAGGEEPYSLAILMDQLLGPDSGWNVSVLATDLNPAFLDKARRGVYRPWSFRLTDIQQDTRYFERQGNDYILNPRVRDCVRFAYLNLVKDVYPSASTGTLGLDLILFRNVSIYLKPAVTQVILQRMCGALRPGGWLLLGETEVNLAPSEGFVVRRMEQATLYQKISEGAPHFDALPALPAPVLAEVRYQQSPGAFATDLPNWVPLPETRAAGSGPSPVHAGAAGKPGPPDLWGQIEEPAARQHFAKAEVLIDGIASEQQRGELRLRYAKLLLEMGESARARGMVEQSLREAPMTVEAQLLHASFCEESGDFAEAEKAWRRALYLDRSCAIAHFHLALLQRNKDLRLAQRSLRIVFQLCDKQDPHALVEHADGVCYGRLREMAIAVFEAEQESESA
ncbi:CheR family methyltransferase [Lignipirellula cremea]|uniref:Chemotaxis protein methyltransferase Cher2 n=1 Tax=Lignipirellula cremea TaxID=2528010 RepID=A0A518DYU8_9BACT|nr:protein-glutamate O-methyltransferase CheR [Lignipirellula cremea]QDU97019.1 Chemotaxis protein methyltransferase Cher2 [Lignipirellula cremea]